MLNHGIEQEFQVVTDTGRMVPRVAEILAKLPSNLKVYGKGGITKDKYATQLEIATDVCPDLDKMRKQLLELREAIVQATRASGLRLIASGCNPLANPRIGEFFSEHHHLDAPTPKEKAHLNNFIRIFTPDLFALSVFSPIVSGRPTRYQSFRGSGDAHHRPNPNIKAAPYITPEDLERGHLEKYDRKKSRYFDLTPFTKEDRVTKVFKPTVEVRLFDIQPSIPYTLGYAALLEALVLKSRQFPGCPRASIQGNRDAAVERGLHARFISHERGFEGWREPMAYQFQSAKRSLFAHEAVQQFILWLQPELKELGYAKLVEPLERMVRERRTMADFQLSLFQKGPEGLVSELQRLTMEGYEKEVLPTRTFTLVEEKDIEALQEKVEKRAIPEPLQAGVDAIKLACRRIPNPETRALTHAIGALAELQVRDSPWFQEQLSRLMKRQDPSGSLLGTQPVYHTALFLDALRACKVSTGLSKEAAAELDKRFEAALRWLQKKEEWTSDVWLMGYVLSVLNKAGAREEQVAQKLSWLEARRKPDGSFGAIWVTAFAMEALSLFGKDTRPTREWLLAQRKTDHWEAESTDPVLLTALILRGFVSVGERPQDVARWLQTRIPRQVPTDSKELYRLAVVLQSLAGMAG